jgi:hypothetical protein
MPYGHHLYINCNIGPRMELRGTPAAMFLDVENSPSTKTINFLSVRKEAISLIRFVENSNADILHSRTECHIISSSIVVRVFDAVETCLRRHCLVMASWSDCCSLAMDASSPSTIPAFSHHVTLVKFTSIKNENPFSFSRDLTCGHANVVS